MITDHRFIANFKRYKFLLSQLVERDIKIKYRRSVLGIFWSFLQPLLMMVVLTIVFSQLFASNIENYPVYLLTGKLIFDFFSQGTRSAMMSITKAEILKKVYIPKYMYTLSSIISSFVTFLLSLVVLFMVMLVTNVDFTIYIIFTSLPILALLVFTVGVGLILATATLFFRDMEHLYGVFVTLLMYGTPIFYPPEIIPESFRFLLDINPLYAIISCCRSVFMDGTIYDPSQLLFATASAIVALVLGIAMFYKYQDKFILHM